MLFEPIRADSEKASESERIDLRAYGERLRAAGVKTFLGSQNTIWVSRDPCLTQLLGITRSGRQAPRGPLVMQRHPHVALYLPADEEIRNVLKHGRIAVLSFAVSSSEFHALSSLQKLPTFFGQSYLYVCRDQQYSPQKLGQSARSHLRRSLNAFEFRLVDQEEILRLGMPAYGESHARFGLGQVTREQFETVFGRAKPVHRYIGAFRDARLAAFLCLTQVDNWASLGASYSLDECLPLRPNNGLHHFALHHYLVEKKFHSVDDGLSNFPITPKVETLHRFKVKVGFEAVPVYRVFVVNPLLRPIVNRTFLKVTHGLIRMWPSNSLLKKAELVLSAASESERN